MSLLNKRGFECNDCKLQLNGLYVNPMFTVPSEFLAAGRIPVLRSGKCQILGSGDLLRLTFRDPLRSPQDRQQVSLSPDMLTRPGTKTKRQESCKMTPTENRS